MSKALSWSTSSPWKEEAQEACFRILVVEDDEIDCMKLKRLLLEIFGTRAELSFVHRWDDAEATIATGEHQICIIDQNLDTRTGLELIQAAARDDDQRIFILLTGQDSRELDLAASRAGVVDYLTKDELTVSRLERSLRYAIEAARQKRLLIEQAIALRDAKVVIEAEVVKQQSLTEHLRRTKEHLVDALNRAESSEKEYRWLAQHDQLTRIPNRALFADRLRISMETVARTGMPLALFLLDLDRFKQVNDALGHQVGDQLLIEAANRLTQVTRKTDIVARLGGDEFAIVATNLHSEGQSSVAAQKIIEALSSPFDIAGNRIESGVSIGIAVHNGQDETTPDDMMQKADAALYKAKANGRGNFHFFDDALNREVRRIQLVKTELRQAVETGQFSLVFQPKISLVSGKLTGLEALTRWKHPTLGNIPPNEFFPIAEMTRQVLPLSHWIMEEACRTIAAWQGTALAGVPVALNLSAVQLRQLDLVPNLSKLLRDFSLPPSVIELEVTETAAMENLALAVEQLTQLRAYGIRVSIDDFGTGYSSLKLATTLPADALKIDMSFVSGMLERASDAAAVEATTTLAHSLGMIAVAEGVESAEQLAYLRERNCDQAQGYLIARPLPRDDILDWHRHGWRPAEAMHGLTDNAKRSAMAAC